MRTKRALYNFFTDLIPLIIIALIGFLKLKLINENLGFAMSGMNTLFVNIMTYLSIMDGGLASALIFRLYKPISEKNQERINELASAAHRIFNSVGFIMLGIGFVVSFFVFFLFKQEGEVISYTYVRVSFLIYLASTVIPYFVLVEKSLFEADQKKYKINIVLQTFTIIRSLLEIVILMLGYGLIAMYISMTVLNLLSSLIIAYMTKKEYPLVNFKNEKKDYGMLKDVKHLMVHKVGTMVAYNIDAVIISNVIGVASVPFYTAYQYITDNLMTMIGKITYSITAGVGDLIASSQERAYGIFREINAMCFYIATVVCVPLLLVINPFINIWQPDIQTTEVLAILFVAQLLYYIIRMPLSTFANAAGLFKETRICPILESVINLVLSLALVHQFGIAGVLLATLISYLFSDYFIRPFVIYRNVFDKMPSDYYLLNCFYLIVMILLTFVMSHLMPYLNFSGYISWFISSCIIFGINAIAASLIYVVTKQASFMNRALNLLKRRSDS